MSNMRQNHTIAGGRDDSTKTKIVGAAKVVIALSVLFVITQK